MAKKTTNHTDLKEKPIPEGRHLLEVDNLKMFFHTEDGIVHAVNGVSYTLDRGETLGVVGESGSGKSVTAMTIMGLIDMPPGKIEGGHVYYRGESLLDMTEEQMQHIRGNDIAMIFQDPMTSLNPVVPIGKQIEEVIRLHHHCSAAEATKMTADILEKVGIPADRYGEYPHQFSGGMKQRVVIAMALVCNPELLIADEPTTALDVTVQAQILDLLRDIAREQNTAIIMITHDLGVVAQLCERVNIMYAGQIVERGTLDEIFYEPHHPYTRGLLQSVCTHGAAGRQGLSSIPGTPPDLLKLNTGCAFMPRCAQAMKICKDYMPVPHEFSTSHCDVCWNDCREAAGRVVAAAAAQESEG